MKYEIGTVLRNYKFGYIVQVVSWEEFTKNTEYKPRQDGFAHIMLFHPKGFRKNSYGWDLNSGFEEISRNDILEYELEHNTQSLSKYDRLAMMLEHD